jgi:hypothetical protein
LPAITSDGSVTLPKATGILEILFFSPLSEIFEKKNHIFACCSMTVALNSFDTVGSRCVTIASGNKYCKVSMNKQPIRSTFWKAQCNANSYNEFHISFSTFFLYEPFSVHIFCNVLNKQGRNKRGWGKRVRLTCSQLLQQ